MLFYQQLSDACEKAGTANTLSARTMSLAAPKGGKLSLKVKIDVNKLKERADALAEDSETWAEGQEITAAEIRQIKDFLDDNPGLVDLYKMHQSTGGDNPYQVVGDIRATYYERGMGLIEKALSLATGKPKDVVDTLKDGIKDYAIDTVKGKIFYRQSEGMVCDLYVAARQAERTETGAGGLTLDRVLTGAASPPTSTIPTPVSAPATTARPCPTPPGAPTTPPAMCTRRCPPTG